MALKRHLPLGDIEQMVGMLLAGQTQRHVERQFNVSHFVVGRVWQRYLDIGSVVELAGRGRPRKTTDRDDRYIVNMAKRWRFESAKTLNANFRVASGIRISEQTVRNRLHAANIRTRRPAVRPPLKPGQRRLRWAFSQDHHNIPLVRLRSVLFTDESKFRVAFHDGRRRVWRQKNERFKDCCIQEHDRFGCPSELVWGGVSYDGSTDLYVIQNGSLTGVRYRDEILDACVRPYGVIDGTHIGINAPYEHEEVFVNRKGVHSIIVQEVFDPLHRIIDVVVRWPGSVHDSRVLRESGLFDLFEGGHANGYYLLGDSGYPAKRWLLTPYLAPQNATVEGYNRSHKITRALVERSIGQLKKRFGVLHGEINLEPHKVCKVIVACCVLHNICKERAIPINGDDDSDDGMIMQMINWHSECGNLQMWREINSGIMLQQHISGHDFHAGAAVTAAVVVSVVAATTSRTVDNVTCGNILYQL
ncbi:uncharacterized protein LOC128211697 [Mya arenaria]|uniref:uncharacterized protein LOC128211697 n=1 Tax=Mya arenaria TaxID=6604 RepID=UPI0022E938F3|nr:uncharacterized protein LOC128211697 [Mya arenaria]